MNVTYQDRTKQESEGYALLQQATKCLEEVLGSSTEMVSAEWEQGPDARGRTIYTLTLADFGAQVAGTFAPDELRSPSRLRGRLLGLWGDLLQVRSDAQMKRIQQLVTEGVDGGQADSR